MNFNQRQIHIWQAIDNNVPGVKWNLCSKGSGSPRVPPRFLLGPVPQEIGDWFYSDNWVPDSGVYSIENLNIITDRILIKDDYIFHIPETGIGEGSISEHINLPDPIIETRIEDEVVILCGPAYQMYGHWLIDFLPRIYLIEEMGKDIRKIKYLLPKNIRNFSLQWMDILGIPRENIYTYDPFKERCIISNALVPISVRGNSRANPILNRISKKIKQRVIGEKESTKSKKLLVSRKLWPNHSRSLLNQSEIEERFSEKGFDIIFPETLSIKEQISTFHEARIIIGEYGSGMHNSIFSPPLTEVVNFRGNLGHPGFLQSGLCEALGQNCSYLFGESGKTEGSFSISSPRLDMLEIFLPYLLNSN
ncbi:glycosyltransferase family 61 protein [Neokomagataea anthophila]|uniref:Glycosyltransferase family 61 protein n=1 Tax=Neokomagataea anthophila TaxID=2826925 RepID=A0ABS5E9C9_9PROT|nr:glycosyltransferase 61 family protein [Neokomagataea anthophila]MBR0560518.1 glycosyltransferase family 61 protein [Neokomagataea anthophila]